VAKPSGTAGNLKVLNWAGFKAAVSYNFDDANSSQVSNYSTLNGLGVHYTFYLIGNKVATSSSTWSQAVKDGHELGNHTQDHNNVTAQNVDQGQQTIEGDFGVKIHTMAAPNGTTGYDAFAQTRYLLNRGVADGLMMPGNETTPSPFNTFCYIPPTGAATSAFNNEVNGARTSGGWRVILVHGFTGGTDGAFQPVDLAQYTGGVNYAKSFPDVWIDTMVQVGSYWRGQNAFAKATKTTSGSNQTWTWTLPANFPPGKYLRVTVDGGTLTQNGTALVWDTHGYYEIALDVGSVTLSP
jgi:peptidoglycan/xylan/chitin deacetylase (PgdA/CDA1 family)